MASAVAVTDLRTLSAGQLGHWRELYARCGTRVQQSPAYAQAMSGAGHSPLVALGPDAVAVFTCDTVMCTALCGDLPFLSARPPGSGQLLAMVSQVRRATGLPVYVPLVAHEYAEVDGQGEARSWPRLPNSLIDWSRDGADLWERVLSRGTSQLPRKRRLVERDGLTLHTGRTGEAAVRDMLAVDDASWKAARGQSMRQRPAQLALYSELVRGGTLTATFLRDGGRPVAFRLDGRIKDRVMCLKWSYDESYRRYSPGLYLLTEGLTRQWSGQGIRTVDLYGSPDSLKDLVFSERRERVDVWCGSPRLGGELAAERRELDARVTRVQAAGKGLRHAFG